MVTRVYLVRHCEAQGNIQRVFNGVTDCDISENGNSQLKFLAERFKNLKVDAVYSSPLIRTVKTAQACNYYHSLPIILDENLIEINGGGLEGIKFSDFPIKYPVESTLWNLEPWNFNIENGESMKSVYERIFNAVTDIVKKNYNKNICVVSHGCAIRNLICRCKGYPIERLNEVEWCDNTAVTVIDFDENLQPVVISENDASHLPVDFSTLSKQSWWKKENRDSLIFD